MPTLRQIEVFRATFLRGGISSAAAELKASQPTVSRIIRRLEDELGTPLFLRVKGRLVPTAACERFAAEIDRAYGQLQDALQRASLSSRGDSRPFNVASSPSIGRRLVPEALAAIAGKDGQTVSLRIVTVSQVLPALLDRECDCAVTLFSVLHQDVETNPIGDVRPMLLVPRTFDADLQHDRWPQTLAGRPWVTFEPRSVHGEALAAILGEAAVTPRRTHLVRFAETAVGLVEAGLGCTIVDRFSAETADPARVAAIPLGTAQRFRVHLHRPVGGDHGALGALLRDHLSALIAERLQSMP
jgi:DNA-binding transcriptional LysR family regulator